MQCTSCKTGELKPAYLDDLLLCHTCSNCGGSLLMLSDYLRWQGQNQGVDMNAGSEAKVEPQDTSRAMLCPLTGRLMTKYKISKDSEHRLDLSPTVNAIWIDSGEWALLKESGLADNLNDIFTNHWQQELRSQASTDILKAMYEKRFGDDYSMIKEFRAKLRSLENRSEVLAYLIAEDPYEP